MTDPTYRPGLEGVVAGESAISRIDVERNRLIIRGYDLVDLTSNSSFEEVAYLLLNGELPDRAQLGAFLDTLRSETLAARASDGVLATGAGHGAPDEFAAYCGFRALVLGS